MNLKYIPLADRSRTWFIDLDGTIFRQDDRWPEIKMGDPRRALLPGVQKKLTEWHMRGDHIVITTARPEAYREITLNQLTEAGIMFHQLVMGLPTGKRILINDTKPQQSEETALAINLERDEGLEGVDL